MQITKLYNLLGEQIGKQLGDIPPLSSTNSQTLEGNTPEAIRAGVTKAQVGLGSVQNYPTAASAAAIAGADNASFDTLSGANARIVNDLSRLTGSAGDMFFLTDALFSSLVSGASLNFLSVIATDAELTTMLNTQEKMADVFNSWKKISRGNWADGTATQAAGYSDASVQTELDAFTYDAATDKIKNPSDTHSLVGFISPNSYDNYVIDVILRSDSTWQNDPLGLIVAYTQDADGTTHTLSVMRNLWYPSYATYGAVDVMVDYNTIGATFIKTQRANLLWVDGSDAAGAMNPTSSPWAIKPWVQATNGCRLKVTRAGDTFTVETGNYDVVGFVDAAKFTFTLNDHASLARFKGPQRYGYAAISQDNAIWDVQTRPGARQAIVDIRDKSVREWDGTQWAVKTSGWATYIKPNRFYYNRTTNRLFYADNETTLLPIL